MKSDQQHALQAMGEGLEELCAWLIPGMGDEGGKNVC